MKTSTHSCIFPALLAAGICLISSSATAELRIFTVDHSQSSLSFSGFFVGITLNQQGPGSLTARYTGTIVADVTGSAITFLGGSSVVASNSGSWQPMPGGAVGSAPANYGGTGSVPPFLSGNAAVRNILLDITSAALAITGTNFPAQNATFIVPSNALAAFDYRYSGVTSGAGTRQLANNSTNNVASSGIINTQGGIIVLTLPVNINGSATVASPNDTQYSLTGQIVARSPVDGPLRVSQFRLTGGQVVITMITVSNQSYAILGSSNLINWNTTNDQFIATNSQTTRTIPLPSLPRQFFKVRQN